MPLLRYLNLPLIIIIKGKATYRVREKIPVSSTTQPKPEKVRLSTEVFLCVGSLFDERNSEISHVKPLIYKVFHDFPGLFLNQTQQDKLQKECCYLGKSGEQQGNPKLPQTGKITIIHVAPRHSIFGKFLGKERSGKKYYSLKHAWLTCLLSFYISPKIL